MKKRFMSLFLAVVMVLAMLPVTASAADCTVADNLIDITDKDLSVFVLTGLTITGATVISATEDGNALDVLLAEGTDPAAALTAGFSGTAKGGYLAHQNNKCTLSDGSGKMTVTVAAMASGRPIGTATYTINFATESSGPAVKFTTDLSTAEVTYTTGKEAAALTVEATHSEGETISYQWYSYTDSMDDAVVIANATDASYTPPTDTVRTTNYYVVATAGELTATSKTVTITVVEPVVQFTTDLSTAEAAYTQGKTAETLTVVAEYTGVTANPVTYQWYSYTDSVDTAVAIEGATEASYTPAAETLGTVCYYVVASCEGLTATSSTAKITVAAPVVEFTTGLSTAEVTYTQGKPASALTVAAEHTGVTANFVTYQWYSYTDSVDTAVAIEGATEASYTPATETLGTVCYYVVASCEGLTATSSTARITVVAPVVEFTTDLSTAEVTYTQGKPASALTVAAEHTGVTVNSVTYQWYSYTDSVDNAAAIDSATDASYTPATEVVGTTYYYVVVSCEGLTATSSIATVTVKEQPTLPVADNVIDITDKTVYSFSRYYAKAINIKIDGATVEKATEDGTAVNIVLAGTTDPSAEISVEFGTSLNRCTMSGHTGSVSLSNGAATLTMTLTGTYVSSRKGSATYTLNFSLGAPPSEVPTRLVETDSAETYAGVAVELDLKEYFSGASAYYLVEDQTKTPLDGSTYTFKTFTGGDHTLVFAASNAAGDCADYATVTVAVTEIKGGAWLGIETSNGSVNYVVFKDESGNEIDGLTATLEGTAINVSVPRTFAADGKITATFDLTQTNGLPKLSTNNRFNGTNDTKKYTTTLMSGAGKATMYLYNSNPSAVNNNPTTYTVNYVIQNEVPVLADGQDATGTGSITADQTYTLDLDGIFVDPDAGDVITGWKVSVDGADPVAAEVDADNVYSWQTNDAGVYTLTFYGLDNYNAASTETYTVTLTVSNAATTYDVTVNVPEGVAPTFYYTADAQEGTGLSAEVNGNVYTVEVPTNVSVISWRADGAGMSAAVSSESSLTLVKPVFKVMAEETEDTEATVTVTHANNLVGSSGSYLLLAGGGYTITATPSADYASGWNEGKLTNHTVTADVIEIPLVSKDITITVPRFAELFVGEASSLQGVPATEITPSKSSGPDFASGTTTYSYKLTNNKVYEYRVSLPADNVTRDQYVTYAGTFVKTDNFSLTITADMLESGDNSRTTIDRDVTNNRGKNVGDLYLNVNEKGYKALAVDEEFHLIATRTWWGANADWINTATTNKDKPYVNYYIVEPDFRYSVIGLDGQPSTGVIEIDSDGKITAVGKGTAVVLVTYDAMTMNHDPKTYIGAIEGYKTKPNEFLGAIWPENTGVFVVSVGAEDSGITTGMTINQDKATGQKLVGKALDAELDVIYFIGENGEYTFTPGTEGVTVSVANPTVSETAMSFTGFEAVSANGDGSFSVPLTEGRNIVKLEKDGKAEYQVITAKSVSVTVNGEPLETAAVAPGQTVKLEFDELYAPVNRMAFYNSSAAVVYSKISGWNGKLAGNWRNSMGEYGFASYTAKRVVEHFVITSTDGSSYGNSQVQTSDLLTVPADFEGEHFTLSGGAFNIGGFAKYMLGAHRDRLGKAAESDDYQMSDNLLVYLGSMPDISIPVATPNSIAVTTLPTTSTYKIGDVFDPTGMVVTASYAGTDVTRPVTGYTYDTAAFTEAGEKEITISYGQLTTTVTVTVSDIRLEKIEATTAPTKTLYYIGDTFDPTGMVITATYSDESTCVITDYTYAPETIAKDTSVITVTYGSKTVEVPVTVSLVERLEITSQPTKKSYTEGERFDPAGMVVKAYYTDGSSVETDKYDYTPAGQLSPSDTTITVTYSGDEGAANLQPVTVSITVEKKQEEDKPEEIKSIVVYMTFVDYGRIVAQGAPVMVYDEDKDGKYTIGNAFEALHRDYYSGGESGYSDVGGWVTKFWGDSTATFAYAHNYGWTSSVANSISNGDSLAAINGEDEVFYSDLFTWFGSSYYTATTGTAKTFSVNGLSIMSSSAGHNARAVPEGATVTVYDSRGNVVSNLSTVTDTNGRFELTFTTAGTYTVRVDGICNYTVNSQYGGGSRTNAPVVPATCTVSVHGETVKEEQPPSDTVTPEIEADADGKASVEISVDAVADALEQASGEGKGAVVVAPEVKGEANTVTVTLPKDAVDQITENSDLNLTVETPAASVTIPNAGLTELIEEQDGAVAISVQAVKNEKGVATGEVKVDVAVGGENQMSISGGIVIAVPTAKTEDTAQSVNSNQVLVIVAEDGTETIVAKSVVDETGIKALLDGSATVKVVDNSKKFVDVEPGHWYSEGVDFVSSREIFEGVGNNVFDHAGTMTRGMLVTVLHRLEDEMEHSYEGTFHDVEEDLWYTDAIHWAADHGLVNGYGNGYFGAADEITREQMITMTFRYMNWLGLDTSARGDLNAFTDGKEISDWAKEAMEWGVGIGVVEGIGNDLVDPTGNATRAQVAVFVQRVISLMVK